jgi:hypothetical protein
LTSANSSWQALDGCFCYGKNVERIKVILRLIDASIGQAETEGVPERRFALRVTYVPLLCLSLMAGTSARAQELPEVGAPRVLRLVDFQGKPLNGSFSEVAWETRGDGLFFTLENHGTRNIWRAFPDPQDKSRFPAWKALPITEFKAPQFVSKASVIYGDRALVCLSNVQSKTPQIYRFDLRSPGLTPLVKDDSVHSDPAVSPDGRIISFTREKDNASSVWGVTIQGGEPFLLSNQARRAVWYGENRLVFESLASGSRGLYTRDLKATQARLLIGGGGEVGASPSSQSQDKESDSLFFSARTDAASPPRLYMLAPDGSGLRVLGGTEGARRPAVSTDGRFLAYDAPLLSGVFASNSKEPLRSLWVIPLNRKSKLIGIDTRWAKSSFPEPTPSSEGFIRNSVISNADISSPRESDSKAKKATPPALTLWAELKDVSVLKGAVYSPSEVEQPKGAVAVRGTIKGGSDLTVTLEVGEGDKPTRWSRIPVTQNVVDNDTLALWTPPRPLGDWTLRLTVFSRGGAAQSILRVKLPLGGSPASRPAVKNVQMVPEATLPPLPLPPPAPIPGLAPYPLNLTTPVPQATPNPRPAFTPILPPKPVTTPETPKLQGPAPTFIANFNVSGVLAKVAPNQKTTVTFWGHNTGTATWQTGGKGADRVRLVARWVDFSTGTRRKWNFHWLKSPVVGGGRTKFEIELAPPTRPGKYKLIYGLVRLPAGGEYTAPAYNLPQEAWPAEFSAIAFAVEVVPPVVDDEGEESAFQ